MRSPQNPTFTLVGVTAAMVGEFSIAPLPTVFKFFVFDALTNSFFGLAGAGGGGLSAGGLVSFENGFFSFDLTALKETLFVADTNQYVNTAFALIPVHKRYMSSKPPMRSPRIQRLLSSA